MNLKIPWHYRKPFRDQTPEATGTRTIMIDGKPTKVTRYDMDAGTRAWLDRRERDLPSDEEEIME